jgi:hypothetical protein
MLDQHCPGTFGCTTNGEEAIFRTVPSVQLTRRKPPNLFPISKDSMAWLGAGSAPIDTSAILSTGPKPPFFVDRRHGMKFLSILWYGSTRMALCGPTNERVWRVHLLPSAATNDSLTLFVSPPTGDPMFVCCHVPN